MTIITGGSTVHVHLWWLVVAGCLWGFGSGFGGAIGQDVRGHYSRWRLRRALRRPRG